MIKFPKTLEKILLRYLKEISYSGTRRATHIQNPFDQKDLIFFYGGVEELSRKFTSERSRLYKDYWNQPSLRSGYLLYFVPIQYGKASWIFSKIPNQFWKSSSFRILDLGCGPGTAGLAFLEKIKENSQRSDVEIHLVDQNKKVLQDAKFLLERWHRSLKISGRLRLFTYPQYLSRFRPTGNFDLVTAHHALNEMTRSSPKDRSLWLSPLLHRHLKKEGYLSLMEPALINPGRELMELRDHLVSPGPLSIVSPCLHENICPMLAGTRKDWCHFYLDWEEPAYLKKIDRRLRRDNHLLRLSYIIFTKQSPKPAKRKSRYFRVVSNRMKTRGKTEMVLCGSPGRIQITRLDRNRSKKNEALDRIRRGDLVSLPTFKGEHYQLNGKMKLGKGEFISKADE